MALVAVSGLKDVSPISQGQLFARSEGHWLQQPVVPVQLVGVGLGTVALLARRNKPVWEQISGLVPLMWQEHLVLNPSERLAGLGHTG